MEAGTMTADEFELLRRLVDVANQKSDGHLSILKFTTNWRVSFETPGDRDDIAEMATGRTFGEAAQKALSTIAEQ